MHNEDNDHQNYDCANRWRNHNFDGVKRFDSEFVPTGRKRQIPVF